GGVAACTPRPPAPRGSSASRPACAPPAAWRSRSPPDRRRRSARASAGSASRSCAVRAASALRRGPSAARPRTGAARPRPRGGERRHRAPLVRRQLERQRLAVAGHDLARGSELGRALGLALPCSPREPELEDEQLVEGEPPPAELRLALVPRLVESGERVGEE